MSYFLTTVPVEVAVSSARSIGVLMPAEEVPLATAHGRILAADIAADIDIPGFNRSSVDGYAVRSRDTIGASESLPTLLHLAGMVAMGGDASDFLQPDSCIYVPTGGALPQGADAMVMVEYTEKIGDDVLIRRPVAQGENIVLRGEDFSAGSPALFSGTRLSPREAGALAAMGRGTVPVYRKPRVGVISTGNELVPVGDIPAGSQVRDINSWMCGAFLESQGCIPDFYGICRDDREALRSMLIAALHHCDAVLISGGSSKDDRDMTADLIRESGEVLHHGIALSPGKPTIIGRVARKPVIGLPGHPASAYVVLLVIVQPLLTVMTGERERRLATMRALLAENIPSARGRDEYVRVRLEGTTARPEFGKSGLINTLVRSDGLVRVPSGTEGFEEGEEVEVILW